MKIAAGTKWLCSCVLALGSSLSGAFASVIVVAPDHGRHHFYDPFNKSVGAVGIIFDEWVISDGVQWGVPVSTALVHLLNGALGMAAFKLFDNFAVNIADITANDGYFYGNVSAFAAEDVFVLKAGTYSLAAESSFNPQATQTFTGDIFLTDATGVRISDNVPVPEPATSALLAVGHLATTFRRRARR